MAPLIRRNLIGKGSPADLGEWFVSNRDTIRKDLDRYFGEESKNRSSGRWFEKFGAMGDPNRFEASDLLAVEALSADVPLESAAQLLISEANRFNSWLALIPADKDLWEVERSVVDSDSAADRLHAELDELPKVGWVTASKLIAAKRPRLIPILDKEMKHTLRGPKRRYWVAMHDQLAEESRRALIANVCDNAPTDVSLLRRIEVALLMHSVRN